MKTTNFNLLTERDKNAVHDQQDYHRLIQAEIENDRKDTNSRKIINDRCRQLIDYQEKVRADKKELKIKLRSEALNLIREKQISIVPSLTNKKRLTGAKIFNMDNSIAKKWKDYFDIPTEEKGTGTNNGYRISCQISKTYINVYLKIDVSMWRNKVNHSEHSQLSIYKLEDDDMTIKEITEFKPSDKVNLAHEKLAAKKYLEYQKKADKKLEELKAKCNPYMLEIIKNNQ